MWIFDQQNRQFEEIEHTCGFKLDIISKHWNAKSKILQGSMRIHKQNFAFKRQTLQFKQQTHGFITIYLFKQQHMDLSTDKRYCTGKHVDLTNQQT